LNFLLHASEAHQHRMWTRRQHSPASNLYNNQHSSNCSSVCTPSDGCGPACCTSAEVQKDVFEQELKPWMEDRGYSSLYNPRPPVAGSRTVGPKDGVSLHFKNCMFRWSCCSL
jgi:hypothetical protein